MRPIYLESTRVSKWLKQYSAWCPQFSRWHSSLNVILKPLYLLLDLLSWFSYRFFFFFFGRALTYSMSTEIPSEISFNLNCPKVWDLILMIILHFGVCKDEMIIRIQTLHDNPGSNPHCTQDNYRESTSTIRSQIWIPWK